MLENIFNNIAMKRLKLKRKHLWKFYVFPLIFFTTVTCYPTTKPEVETPEVRDEKHFPNGTVIGRYTYMDNEGNPIQVKYYADDASYGVELKSIKVVDSEHEPLPLPTKVHSTHVAQKENHAQKNPNRFDYTVLKSTDPDTKMSTDFNPNFPSAQTGYPTGYQTGYPTGYQTGYPTGYQPGYPTGYQTGYPTGSQNQNGYPAGYKYKNDPFDFLKDVNKANHYKVEKEKPNPDYDIFYQNELRGAKKCSKQKVRVYYDENEANRKLRSAVQVNTYNDADKFCEQF
ncbi:uncharacterized protein LOC118282306 [Spodoptera frugiperda]|uniref:Uncharacterized protein LOC118282306 n=1 Tax=Spodoptera frugiperda TaxID=7108 RepID=A0A9R0DL35_SPOFR|nr:uncharacterized protein LOC118282306 [Spodoptera frugiperda]